MSTAQPSPESRRARPAPRPVGPFLAVVTAVALCGFALYWSEARLQAVTARLDRLERGIEASGEQSAAGGSGQAVSVSASGAGSSGASGPVRLARIVDCRIDGNLVAVGYDPVQVFVGAGAVGLAASHGVAVTGDTYLFDPTGEVFSGQAPVGTPVTIHQAPSGWTGALPTTIAELAAALEDPAGRAWSREYFSLLFNQGYIVGIEQESGLPS